MRAMTREFIEGKCKSRSFVRQMAGGLARDGSTERKGVGRVRRDLERARIKADRSRALQQTRKAVRDDNVH